jgi:GH24 family phage-related lysozyme (muramidase)
MKFATLIPMNKNRLSLFFLIFAFILFFSNTQVTTVENITYYPTQITMIAPDFTHYPTYTQLSCPSQESFAIRTSEEGLKLITFFEGLENAAYLDSRGFCTVGIGHLIREGACQDGDWPLYVSDEQAMILLRDDISKIDFQIFLAEWKFTQTQFDAISSTLFNLGLPNFKKTRIYAALQDGDYSDVPWAIRVTTCCVSGLIARREAEAKLWETGDYGLSASGS